MTPDAHPIFPWLTPPRRAWLYRVALAVLGVLVCYGLITGDELAPWLETVTALLGIGTAALHTPTR